MFPEWIQIFLSSAPLAVMEDVQLCFLWRESRGRANSPCRRGLQGGRARSKMLAMIFPFSRHSIAAYHMQEKHENLFTIMNSLRLACNFKRQIGYGCTNQILKNCILCTMSM